MFRIVFAAALGLAAWQAQQAAPANIPGPITPPKLLSSDTHAHPECDGIQPAEVKLQFTVTADGVAKDAKVLASPSPAHSACAIALVNAYQYLPAMQDGKAVNVQLVLTLSITAGS